MNVKLLRKVARHILAEPKRLYMTDFYSRKERENHLPHKYAKCGTAACIAGWSWRLSSPRTPQNRVNIPKMLGVTQEESLLLVWTWNWPKKFRRAYKEDGSMKSAKVAAARIEHFIKTKGRE